jgi:hypothetical protein
MIVAERARGHGGESRGAPHLDRTVGTGTTCSHFPD